MLTEILPFLFILTVEVVKNIKSKAAVFLLVVAVVYSVAVHSVGVFYKKSRCGESNNWNFSCITP